MRKEKERDAYDAFDKDGKIYMKIMKSEENRKGKGRDREIEIKKRRHICGNLQKKRLRDTKAVAEERREEIERDEKGEREDISEEKIYLPSATKTKSM